MFSGKKKKLLKYLCSNVNLNYNIKKLYILKMCIIKCSNFVF